MSAAALVPMIAPDGSSADVPTEQIDAATRAGAKRAVFAQAPDGSFAHVPIEQANAVTNAGGKVYASRAAYAQQLNPDQPAMQPYHDPLAPLPVADKAEATMQHMVDSMKQGAAAPFELLHKLASPDTYKGEHPHPIRDEGVLKGTGTILAHSLNPIAPDTGQGTLNRAADTFSNTVGGALTGEVIGEAAGLRKTPAPPEAARITTPEQVSNLRAASKVAGEHPAVALPEIRNALAQDGIDLSKIKDPQEVSDAVLQGAKKAQQNINAEVAGLTKHYADYVVDQAPVAQAIRAHITPELIRNEPQVAARLEAEAAKYDTHAPLSELNATRIRTTKENAAFYNKQTPGQINSAVEQQAQVAANRAIRDLQYSTLEKLAGLPDDYVQSLKRREGSVIEVMNELAKKSDQMQVKAAELATKPDNAVNRAANSKTGKVVGKVLDLKVGSALKEIAKPPAPPAPELFAKRLKSAFGDLGAAEANPQYEPIPAPEPKGLLSAAKPSAQVPLSAPGQSGMDTPARAFTPGTSDATSSGLASFPSGNQTQMNTRIMTPDAPPVGVIPEAPGNITTPNGVVHITEPIIAKHLLDRFNKYRTGKEFSGLDSATQQQLYGVAKQLQDVVDAAKPGTGQYRPAPLRRVEPPPTTQSFGTKPASSARSYATVGAVMAAAKAGDITPQDADKQLQRLQGGTGTLRRIPKD